MVMSYPVALYRYSALIHRTFCIPRRRTVKNSMLQNSFFHVDCGGTLSSGHPLGSKAVMRPFQVTSTCHLLKKHKPDLKIFWREPDLTRRAADAIYSNYVNNYIGKYRDRFRIQKPLTTCSGDQETRKMLGRFAMNHPRKRKKPMHPRRSIRAEIVMPLLEKY